MVTNVCAKFHYGPMHIKKALGNFWKGNNNPNNNHRSELGPFLGPKTQSNIMYYYGYMFISMYIPKLPP